MTNTKFRKRALLSSVAMLLVALVALGSATFAWFVSNPNATASGLKLKTTASEGLVITTDTDVDGSVQKWSHNATLGKGLATLNLDPASQSQASPNTFYGVQAKKAEEYDPKEETPTSNQFTVGHTDASNVFSEKVYFRLTDGSAIPASGTKNVVLNAITISGHANANSMKNAIRVSIAKNGTLLGTYCLATDKAHGTLDGNAITSTYVPVAFTGGLNTTVSSPVVLYDANLLANVGTDTLSTYENIDVYVWLDGQDENCFSEGVSTQDASELISGVELSFALVSA